MSKAQQIALHKQAHQVLGAMLHHPEFGAMRARVIAEFNQDAARFDLEVPAKRAQQVRKLYKMIKASDESTYQALKPLRTAIGWLREKGFDILYRAIQAGIKKPFAQPIDRIIMIYSFFALAIHDEFVEHAVKFQSGDSFTVEDCGRMLQDPVHGKWVRYFAYGYPLILSSIPENRWEQNQLETDHPISNLRIEDRWFCTYVGFEQGSAQAAAPAAAPSKSDPEERAPRA